jgi:FkbM family methyltransferase
MDKRDSSLKRLVKASPLGPFARRVAKTYRDTRRYLAERDVDDRSLIKVMRRVLSHDSNCVDAGAHRGRILRHIVRLAPEGTHFAFEPLPGLAGELRREFPGVQVMETALADVTERAIFRHVLNAEWYSGFERRPWDTYEEEVTLIEVQVKALDEILPPDLPIRFMKLDVEGSEYRLLKGAQRILGSSKPFVAMELGSEQERVFDLLADSGLAMFLLDAWLAGRPSLTRQDFLSEVDKGVFTFLAAPTSVE